MDDLGTGKIEKHNGVSLGDVSDPLKLRQLEVSLEIAVAGRMG